MVKEKRTGILRYSILILIIISFISTLLYYKIYVCKSECFNKTIAENLTDKSNINISRTDFENLEKIYAVFDENNETFSIIGTFCKERKC